MTWRHATQRDCKVSVADSVLTLDADGWVVDGMTAMASAKLQGMPRWSQGTPRRAPIPVPPPIEPVTAPPPIEPAPVPMAAPTKGKRKWQ